MKRKYASLVIFIVAKLIANVSVLAANNWFFLWTADDICRLDRTLLFVQNPGNIFNHVWLPLPFIVQGLLSFVFPNPALVASLFNTVLSLLIIVFFFKLVELLELDRKVFCLTSVIFICTPYYTWITLSALGETYYFVTIVFWVYFYLLSLKSGSMKYKFLGALFLFLATLVRYEAYMFVAVFLIIETCYLIKNWVGNRRLPRTGNLLGYYISPGFISVLGIILILTAHKIRHNSFLWAFEVVRYWQDTRFLNTQAWKKFLLLGSWLTNLYVFPLVIFIPFAIPAWKKRPPLALVLLGIASGEFLLMSLIQSQSPVSCAHSHKIILITNLLLLPFISQSILFLMGKWKALKIALWCFFVPFFSIYLLVSLQFYFQRSEHLLDIWNAGKVLLQQADKTITDGKILVELFPDLPFEQDDYLNDTLQLKYRFGGPRKVILDHSDYKSYDQNNKIAGFRPEGKGILDTTAEDFQAWVGRFSVVGIISTSPMHLAVVEPFFDKVYESGPYSLFVRTDVLPGLDRKTIRGYTPGRADWIRNHRIFRCLYQLFQPQFHPYRWESFFITP